MESGEAFFVCEFLDGVEVVAEGAAEEDRVLGDECETVAEGGYVYIFQGVIVNVDGACFGTGYGEKC